MSAEFQDRRLLRSRDAGWPMTPATADQAAGSFLKAGLRSGQDRRKRIALAPKRPSIQRRLEPLGRLAIVSSRIDAVLAEQRHHLSHARQIGALALRRPLPQLRAHEGLGAMHIGGLDRDANDAAWPLALD